MILARRMGVESADRRLRLVCAVWSAIIVTGCGDLVMDSDGVRLGPELMFERINESFDTVHRLDRPLGLTVIPPIDRLSSIIRWL